MAARAGTNPGSTPVGVGVGVGAGLGDADSPGEGVAEADASGDGEAVGVGVGAVLTAADGVHPASTIAIVMAGTQRTIRP